MTLSNKSSEHNDSNHNNNSSYANNHNNNNNNNNSEKKKKNTNLCRAALSEAVELEVAPQQRQHLGLVLYGETIV